jgi:hypothetical protein
LLFPEALLSAFGNVVYLLLGELSFVDFWFEIDAIGENLICPVFLLLVSLSIFVHFLFDFLIFDFRSVFFLLNLLFLPFVDLISLIHILFDFFEFSRMVIYGIFGV